MFFNIVLRNVRKRYDFEELIKVFFHDDEFEIHALEQKVQGTFITPDELEEQVKGLDNVLCFTLRSDAKEDKNLLKKEMYETFCSITGKKPPWGILTGVRPVKLAGSLKKPRETFLSDYCLSKEKADEIIDIYEYQQANLKMADQNSAGIYVGIPFCPTRCLYCSFTSNQPKGDNVERYLKALHKEIVAIGKGMQDTGIFPESIYIGGGTPTTLDEMQLENLLREVREHFDMENVREFTVEAGRPDTITEEKLKVMKDFGVDRISINPQSMKERTLELIGRSHKPEDIRKAFAIAKRIGFKSINADHIAGLPEEELSDFENTLHEVMALGADNITVHTLAVKRASRLVEMDKDYHHRQADTVSEMMNLSKRILKENGYRPYYLYRQKHMSGSLENVGYCKNDRFSVYNIRIMDETQSIIALGAGGMSKVYFPEENRLERVPNVSNYEIYIDRIDEMIERKNKNIFDIRR